MEKPTAIERVNKREQSNNYWNRKGVIQMDPNDEKRCSHTTVPPSSMMTLAMELLVSNRGKASKLFRKAKERTQPGTVDDESTASKLANLWVVPKNHYNESRPETLNTASHLKPSLANVDFILRQESNPELSLSPLPVTNQLDATNAGLEPNELANLRKITISEPIGSEDYVTSYTDSDGKTTRRNHVKLHKTLPRKSKGQRRKLITDMPTNNYFKPDLNKRFTTVPYTWQENKPGMESNLCQGTTDSACKQENHAGSENMKDDSLSTNHSIKSNIAAACHDNVAPFMTAYPATLVSSSYFNRASYRIPTNDCGQAKSVNKILQFEDNRASDKWKYRMEQADESSAATQTLEKENETSNATENNRTDERKNHHYHQVIFYSEVSEENVKAKGFCNISPVVVNASHIAKGQPSNIKLVQKHQFQKLFDFKQNVVRNITPPNVYDSYANQDVKIALISSTRSLPKSLVPLSSLESISSPSLYLSSVASCHSNTSDCVELYERKPRSYRRKVLLKEDSLERGEHSLSDHSDYLISFRDLQVNKDFVARATSLLIYNLNCGCAVGTNKQICGSCLKKESSHHYNPRLSSSNEQSHTIGNTKSRIAIAGRRDDGDGKANSISSRKVVCNFTDAFPSAADSRKSPGPIISQAVFQDEEHSAVATPILYLCKNSKRCSGCKCKMSLCCCARLCSKSKVFPSADSKKIENSTQQLSSNIPSVTLPVSTKRQSKERLKSNGKSDDQVNSEIVEVVSGGILAAKTCDHGVTFHKESPLEDDLIKSRVTTTSNNTECRVTPFSVQATKRQDTHLSSASSQQYHLPQNEKPLSSHNSSSNVLTVSSTSSEQNKCFKEITAMTTEGHVFADANPGNQSLETSVLSEWVEEQDSITGGFKDFNRSIRIETPREFINPNPRICVVNGSKIKMRNTVTLDNSCDVLEKNRYDIAANNSLGRESKSTSYKLANVVKENDIVPSNYGRLQSDKTESLAINDHDRKHAADPFEVNTLDTAKQTEHLPAHFEALEQDCATNHDLVENLPHSVFQEATSVNPEISVGDSNAYLGFAIAIPVQRKPNRFTDYAATVEELEENKIVQDQLKYSCCPTFADEQPLVKFEGQDSYSITRVDEQTERTYRTVRMHSITSESTIEQINLNDCNSTTSSESEMPNELVLLSSECDYETRPKFSSSVIVSLRPANENCNSVGNISPYSMAAQPTLNSQQATSESYFYKTKETHPENRKWNHKWISAHHDDSAKKKDSLLKQVHEYEQKNAKAHSSKLSPTRIRNKLNYTTRPPTELPCTQTVDPTFPYNTLQLSEFVTQERELEEGLKKEKKKQKKNSPTKKGMVRNDDGNIDKLIQAPPHSITDDKEFSGVVDGPMLKVREIRAKYKVRDYANYAKPRSMSTTSSGSGKSAEEVLGKRTNMNVSYVDGIADNIQESDHVVAQQVMDLFKGALDVEKELAVFEEECPVSQDSKPSTATSLSNGCKTIHSSASYAQTPIEMHISHKPGKLNASTWPPVNEAKSDDRTETKKVNQINAEKVTSFDESLDQFYDVFNDLTS